MKEPPRPKIGRMIGWTIFGAWVGMWCGYIVPLGPWNSILGGMIALFVASLNENAMTGKCEEETPGYDGVFYSLPESWRDLGISLSAAIPFVLAVLDVGVLLAAVLFMLPLAVVHAVSGRLRRKIGRQMWAVVPCLAYQLIITFWHPARALRHQESLPGQVLILGVVALSVLQVPRLVRARFQWLSVQALLFSGGALFRLVSLARPSMNVPL